jgi:hypothetical protein
MLQNEIYLNNPSTGEYNMSCTMSSWILEVHGYRERVSKGGLIWSKHNIYRLEVPKWNPVGLSVCILKKEGQESKTDPL